MPRTRVHWLLPFECVNADSILYCHLASVRLRASAFLRAHDPGRIDFTYGELNDAIVDVLVVGKIGGDGDIVERGNIWIDLISSHLSRGKIVYVDYTDNHISFDSPMAPFYRAVLQHRCVRWIVPSPWMKAFLQEHSSNACDCRILDDAIEVPIVRPDLRRSSYFPLKCLWFGHGSNFDYLRLFLESACHSGCLPVELYILTDNSLLDSVMSLTELQVVDSVFAYSWSLDALLAVSTTVDVSLIPGNLSDPRKAGVGCNRMATSLALGLPVLATPYSSYSRFNAFFERLTQDSLVHLHPEKLFAMRRSLYDFQDKLLASLTLDSMGNKWAQTLVDDQ
jgi:hypothetical protein